MPRLSRYMIRSAFICLAIGFTIGGLILAAKAGVVTPKVWAWLPAHIILLINGWMVQLSLGVAYWITPRHNIKERGRVFWAWSGFINIQISLVLVVIALLDSAMLQTILVYALMLQMIGIAFFAFHLWPRIHPAIIRTTQQSGEKVMQNEHTLPTTALSIAVIVVAIMGLLLLGNALKPEDELPHPVVIRVPLESTSVTVEKDEADVSVTDQQEAVRESNPPVVVEPLEWEVSGNEFSFSPTQLEGVVGQSVTVTFKNTGYVEHDLTIKDIPIAESTTPEVRLYALQGQSASITFTPTKAGSYQIHCSIPGHTEAGMTGTFLVLEQ